jgi:hypothetical protein
VDGRNTHILSLSVGFWEYSTHAPYINRNSKQRFVNILWQSKVKRVIQVYFDKTNTAAAQKFPMFNEPVFLFKRELAPLVPIARCGTPARPLLWLCGYRREAWPLEEGKFGK